MKYIFLLIYIIFGIALWVITPYDLMISHLICKDIHLATLIVSEMGYIPPFFIGYFCIFYYLIRFHNQKMPLKMKHIITITAGVGIISLSIMFFYSMRFLPIYQLITPMMMLPLTYAAYKMALYANKKKWFDFDYLAATGLGLIVTMYFLVNVLKKVYGRARYYLVVDNHELFTEWYVIQKGLAEHRDFYSMPSGHISFVAITIWFIIVLFTISETRIKRSMLVILVFVWILIQGYIRVVMSEHYVTDVLFSVIIATVILNIGYLISKNGIRWLFVKLQI